MVKNLVATARNFAIKKVLNKIEQIVQNFDEKSGFIIFKGRVCLCWRFLKGGLDEGSPLHNGKNVKSYQSLSPYFDIISRREMVRWATIPMSIPEMMPEIKRMGR